MKRLIERLLSGARPVRIAHPVLGTALLVKTKAGAYWEVTTMVEENGFSLSIDTRGADEPSIKQVEFFQRFARHPDHAFALSRSLLVAEYETWMREPFPSDWRQAFAFVGLTVPLDGDEQQPWDLAFECLKDQDGHLFTCHVEGGTPSRVTIDG